MSVYIPVTGTAIYNLFAVLIAKNKNSRKNKISYKYIHATLLYNQ